MTEPDHLRATRAAYDTVAADYAELLHTELARRPLDRAMLASFGELVQAGGNVTVADLGCGPGRVTAYLRSLGLAAFGIDLSPAMVAVARATYPEIPFDEGSMSELDVADGVAGGIVAWYSIIHTPPDHLSALFREVIRVLCPGGYALLAFQVGDHRVHLEQAYGHHISLDAYRLRPDVVAQRLEQCGLVVRARLVREPDADEKTPQAFLLAQKPADGSGPQPT